MLRQIPAANHPDSRPTTRPKSFRFKMSWQWRLGKHSGLLLRQFATLSHVGAWFILFQLLEWSFVFSRLAQKSKGQICLEFLACLGQTLLVKILPTSSPSICDCSKKSKDLLTLFTLQGVGWEMTVIRGRVVHSHKEQRGILKLHFTSFERDCSICIVNWIEYWWQTLI